ncbi:hypothetical protein EW145_g4286 [Phellinidium pouzarii]|uniref:Non-haem dioxygenase N-terminal domain-containing protein n=1 Tax=Phellinidium pouzarii TaxID=167371 RepID=A0A4S4L5H8_9AGAM|nr:hypothetical protein EW145_g4286 [Phellinidium pouzarii]
MSFAQKIAVETSTSTVLQAASLVDHGFESIPIIDMQGAKNLDHYVRQQLAREIRDACIGVGFFYVKNHGIPEERIIGAIDAGKIFFALPKETKLEYDSRKSADFRGYAALLSENHDLENNGDLHEGFNIGPEGSNESGKNEMSGENVWPDAVAPEFKERVLSYYDAAVSFGKTLFPLFAIALDLPEDFFDDKTREAAAIMRILHYPPQTGPHDDRTFGTGAHTERHLKR